MVTPLLVMAYSLVYLFLPEGRFRPGEAFGRERFAKVAFALCLWNILGAIDGFLTHDPVDAVLDVIAAAAMLALWWHDRRKRKGKRRVRKLIGEKSRALLAAVVETAEHLADGVRAPLPQGA